MFKSKADRFSKEDILVSDFARALSHPAKIVILRTLARSTCMCGDLVGNLPLAQSTVSKHIADLKEIGLVIGENDGPRTYYRIDRERYGELLGVLKKALDSITGSTEAKGE